MTEVRFAGVTWHTPILVVSPHLDDAVLSAGNLLDTAPDCSVVTVFAGNPGVWSRLTDWDGACGFELGDDVVGSRRAENDAALSLIGCSSIDLDFLDQQYAESTRPDVHAIADAITEQAQLTGATTLVWPLGLVHDDHERVAAAMPLVNASLPDVEVFAFGDLPYLYTETGRRRIDSVFEQLDRAGIRVQIIPGSAASPGKRAGIDLYVSQKRGLQSQAKLALRQERYWRLVSVQRP